uniref:Lethal(3)malignant brain tumor-like protein 3 n=1 Tax=Lygus hesperus TaxID=30085 RepID=A0A146M3L5_LYGHE
MNAFDSDDSVDTISSDSEDIIIESVITDPNDDLEQIPISKPDAKSSGPVYVQSRMSLTPSVTSTAKSGLPVNDVPKTAAKDVPSEAKVTTIITAPKTYASGIARPTVVGPASNGMVTSRKIVSPGSNVTYVTGVWQGDTRKIVLGPMKRGNPEIQGKRVILPGPGAPQTQPTVAPVSGTSTSASMNVIIPQGSKQISKGYIVSPNAVGGRGTVSILPRTSLIIDGSGGAGGQSKLVSANFIKPRDGRIITASSLRPVSVINSSGGRVISASNLPAGYNLIAVPNKPRPVLPVRAQTSIVTTSAERRVLIGNPSGPLKTLLQEVPKKITPEEKAPGKPQPAKLGKDEILRDIGQILTDLNNSNPTKEPTIAENENSPPAESPASCLSTEIPLSGNDPQPTISSLIGPLNRDSNTEVVKTNMVEEESKTSDSVIKNSQKLPESSGKPNKPVDVKECVIQKSQNLSESSGTPLKEMKECVGVVQKQETPNLKSAEDKPIPVEKALLEDAKKPDDIVTIIEDDNEEDPPEKQSALRKAKILSFPKPKNKNSLLNGSFPDVPLPISKLSQQVPERRKRKDNHKPAVVGEPPQKLPIRAHENIKPIPGAENQHPLRAIRWDGNGMGILPGSTLKLTCNEYGMIEVLEDLLASKIEYDKDSDGELRVKKRDPSEIYCCSICSCYGLLSEFFNENFCSIVCWESMNAQQEAIIRKMEDHPTPFIPDDTPVEGEPKKRKKQNQEGELEENLADEPPVKQKKFGGSFVDLDEDSNSGSQKSTDNASKAKGKAKTSSKQDKSEVSSKPFIKVKSMDSLTGSPISGRQLRARDNLVSSKKVSKYLVGQDLEGVISDDDDKLKGEQIDPFPWSSYLTLTESKPAWVKLFAGPYPVSPNLFKIGFKLEAIDPERQSLFCAATVSDVQGHRVKIHFDGYSNKYDFWTNIDSPNIFPCGFCERHQIPLQPPAGFKKNSFSWQTYHNARKSRPAPLSWFQSYRLNNTSTNMFRNGMKLEAVDRKNTQLICVSSVAGVIDNRILVHFDSWSDVYDYWVETSSPYIHPVGWCEERNRELTPPNGYNPSSFSWDSYLRITKSEAAPAAAFTLRPPKEFKKLSKLEAIDKRSPHVLRVATVKEVLPYQIKLVFDGFPDHFGYWTDDDSPDIHPINWGLKTGHPVAGPPEIRQINLSRCPTPGCVGDGNYKGLMAEFHSTSEECPYTTEHLASESPLQDRLSPKTSQKKKPPALGQESNSDSEDDEKLWKFLDAAVARSCPKGRVAAGGALVKLPNVRPPHQNFKRTSDSSMPVTKIEDSMEDKKTLKKPLERRLSERNIKPSVSPRLRPQPLKTTTGVQAGSPIKGSNVLPDNSNKSLETSDKSKKSSQSKQDSDVFDRMRTKVSSDDRGQKRDVVLWNKLKCLEKIGELGPKFQETFDDLNINGGKLLMMNEIDLQYNGLLTVSESKTLFSLISELRKEASLGLDLWKKVDRV